MSEPFLNKIGEELEGTEELSREMQELNEITNEPGSYIEGKIDLAQSEAIESAFNELVNTAQVSDSGEAKDIPMPLPFPAETDEEELSTVEPAENLAEVLPLPVPKEGPEVSIDPEPIVMETGDASIDPRPIIKEAGEASIDPEPILRETGEAKTLPFPVPMPVSEGTDGLAGVIPILTQGGGVESSAGVEQVVAVYDGSSFSAQVSAGEKPDTVETSTSTDETGGDTGPGDTVVTPINIPEEPSPDDSSPDLIGENG